VLSRGDFWDDAAISRMNIYLGADHIGENAPSIFDYGDRRLIAGGLNTKD